LLAMYKETMPLDKIAEELNKEFHEGQMIRNAGSCEDYRRVVGAPSLRNTWSTEETKRL
jgi:hypothetical protein